MAALRDLTGERFGRLVAIERVGSERGHATWLCECDCGKQIIKLRTHLTQTRIAGYRSSCGCAPKGPPITRAVLVGGEIRTVREVAEMTGMSPSAILHRLNSGKREESGLLAPSRSKKRYNDYREPMSPSGRRMNRFMQALHMIAANGHCDAHLMAQENEENYRRVYSALMKLHARGRLKHTGDGIFVLPEAAE